MELRYKSPIQQRAMLAKIARLMRSHGLTMRTWRRIRATLGYDWDKIMGVLTLANEYFGPESEAKP